MIAMKIIGMIPVYNEEDIIGNVIEHLLSQGIELVILDNGSTDKSHEICSKFLNRGVLSLETIQTEKFQFDLLAQKLYGTACSFRAEWVLLNAADEFLEPRSSDLTLRQAIEREDRNGYNIIQFDNFEFLPTEKDTWTNGLDVRRQIKHYTWNDDLQFRSWKTYPDVKVTGTAGHYPIFPEGIKYKVARNKYVLRHYRIRSYEQGSRKVFTDRMPRYLPEEKERGRHVHYNNFQPDPSYFIIDSRNLNEYKDDDRWITRKTFDWTWGVQGRSWAHPPKSRLAVRIANHIPFAAQVWKAVFLRRKRLRFRPNSRDKA